MKKEKTFEAIAKYNAEQALKSEMTCQAICGDGTGKVPEKHYLGCPRYSSGHSINVNGDCNMGCC